jgi:hypothetical protein
VTRGLLGASGAEKLCALGAIVRFCAAPQLHRWAATAQGPAPLRSVTLVV